MIRHIELGVNVQSKATPYVHFKQKTKYTFYKLALRWDIYTLTAAMLTPNAVHLIARSVHGGNVSKYQAAFIIGELKSDG
jgi:hypothetical protein